MVANRLNLFSQIFALLASLSVCFYSSAAELEEEFIQQELARTQLNPDHTVTFEINAPSEFVFQFLIRRVADYAKDAVAVEFDHNNSLTLDRLDRGSIRITTMENADQLIQRILLFKRPFSYAYYTDMNASTIEAPLDYSLSRYNLTELDSNRTRVQISVVYKSSSRLLSYFVRRSFNSALEDDFELAVHKIEEEYQ